MNTKPRLLIVDGNPYIAGILVQNLKSDFNISVANTGPEAVRMLTQGNHYDCVLTELNLPFFSGLELTKFIRENRFLRNTAVMVLSGATDSDTRINSLNSGVDDFALKPFNPLEIRAKLHALLRRSASPAYETAFSQPVPARLLPDIKTFWQQKTRVLSLIRRSEPIKQSA
ncbi:response regulator transcription factor [Spirosoma rhododendri]|uniref:Response regulator transcription factor n=1 Tax=Spirosoma rhododendri TaxID=2728024 RepID=A0A7L5DQ04_9BACT|nr:response regulator transcription factor [Spirosoma rhododendri]QJD79283.1 response regulator transcription factor [Spirosoma rhododendri]